MKRLLLMLAVLTTAMYVGCKQQVGDRCQVNDDCESGVCNVAKGTCASGQANTGDIDGAIIIDAPVDMMLPSDAPGD